MLDLSDLSAIESVIADANPAEVYNFAARAASSQLFDDPVATGDINGLAVTRLLDVIARNFPEARFCQALSSEVFALADRAPQAETTPASPANAYGAAKTYAWHMVKAFRDQYSIFACGALLYNHESPRRPETFVTRKITAAVARIAAGSKEKLLLGNPNHRRDWGHARDHVRAMHLMLAAPGPGDYVVATGVARSVADFCEAAFDHVGLDYNDHVVFGAAQSRRSEACELRGNPSKAGDLLGWQPEISFHELVAEMVEHDRRLLQAMKGKAVR